MSHNISSLADTGGTRGIGGPVGDGADAAMMIYNAMNLTLHLKTWKQKKVHCSFG